MLWSTCCKSSVGVDGAVAGTNIRSSEGRLSHGTSSHLAQEEARNGFSEVSFGHHNHAATDESYGHKSDMRSRGRYLHGIMLFYVLALITLPVASAASAAAAVRSGISTAPFLNSRATNQSSSLLEVFQVAPPVLTPGPAACKETLMVHSFANSYGQPFVGEYNPPSCDFNRVTFNFTVTSAGRQFDRLALMFFNDTEIWRTSTAEPTQTGIYWTYIKDMSNYLSLFRTPQKIIFDLGNLIDNTYTAPFNTTLTATFFVAEDITPADAIIPVSARKSASDSSSAFVVPDQAASNTLTLPQNVKKAVFTISACGQAAEEFWWSNVLSSNANAFGANTTLYGYSPFRELQLYIDGSLAGVSWPFPVIFTGGVVPGFWRPIVGIDAYDLREDEIDISPFLPLLCDGEQHTFEVRVAGINDDGNGNGNLSQNVGSNWVVTGKVFLWLDIAGSITTGSTIIRDVPAPTLQLFSSSGNVSGSANLTLDYSVKVQRSLSFSANISTSSGSRAASWRQDLTYSNYGRLSNGANVQTTNQNTNGHDASSGGYSRVYAYPLFVYSAYQTLAGGNYTIGGTMDRSKNVQSLGELAFPSEVQSFDFRGTVHPSFAGSATTNRQNGTATYLAVPSQSKSYGSGTTEQDYSLDGIQSNATGSTSLYHRHVLASNGTVVEDEETFGGQTHQNFYPSSNLDKQSFARPGIKSMLGRGPF